jgi:transposase
MSNSYCRIRCAGLDVHKETVVVCARTVVAGRVHHERETFAATASGLLRLADWLEAHRCTQVAMEATGVDWRPVWHVLEGRCALVLANPTHVRNVPGRKSDVNDAFASLHASFHPAPAWSLAIRSLRTVLRGPTTPLAVWLADLLAHGRVRSSFVPPRPIQELRDLTRPRKQLVRQVARHTLRIQKTLEDAQLKITGVVSDLLGASGRAILRGLIDGETDPAVTWGRTGGRSAWYCTRTPPVSTTRSPQCGHAAGGNTSTT